MDFTNIVFWLCLIPAMVCIFLTGRYILHHRTQAKQQFEKYALLLISLAFLGMASMLTLGIFLLVAFLAYGGVKLALKGGRNMRKLALGILIPLLLIPLLYYKYGYFIGTQVFNQEWDTLRDLIIPIGISFYTFQKISFCIDTLSRQQPLPKFLDFMNFASFFPQIVAGPIERRDSLLPQMENIRLTWKAANIDIGLRYIVLGLFFKMCMADNLASAFFQHYDGGNVWVIWMNNIIFGLRIYFDFAGYGLIAYGLARGLGVQLTMNFLSPYSSTNITAFWRRWHISLTGWFRDYIYFNIGGSRTKFWAFNILLVFLISGLWHGASWNFVMWGGLSGIAMILHRCYRNLGLRMWAPLSTLLTLITMFYIWMFFYETDNRQLWDNTCHLLTFSSYNTKSLMAVVGTFPVAILTFCFFALISIVLIVMEGLSDKKTGNPYQWLISPYACGVWVILTIVFNPGVKNSFIYFSF